MVRKNYVTCQIYVKFQNMIPTIYFMLAFKIVLFVFVSFLVVYYHHISDIWLLFKSLLSLSYLFVFNQLWSKQKSDLQFQV
jgi:hypothetical protein